MGVKYPPIHGRKWKTPTHPALQVLQTPMPIQIHCDHMESRELWPPLEDVRAWAAAKIRGGQVAPVATGKVENLLALIDEILDTRAKKVATEPNAPDTQE